MCYWHYRMNYECTRNNQNHATINRRSNQQHTSCAESKHNNQPPGLTHNNQSPEMTHNNQPPELTHNNQLVKQNRPNIDSKQQSTTLSS